MPHFINTHQGILHTYRQTKTWYSTTKMSWIKTTQRDRYLACNLQDRRRVTGMTRQWRTRLDDDESPCPAWLEFWKQLPQSHQIHHPQMLTIPNIDIKTNYSNSSHSQLERRQIKVTMLSDHIAPGKPQNKSNTTLSIAIFVESDNSSCWNPDVQTICIWSKLSCRCRVSTSPTIIVDVLRTNWGKKNPPCSLTSSSS